MNSGVPCTDPVCGRYWINSSVASRYTTAPGVAARFSPTRKREPSTEADPKRGTALVEEARRFAAQGAENPFLDVWFESETTGYAVGAFGLALRTTDGGAQWEPWLHRIENPKGLHLYSIRAVGRDVYIVGEQGLLLKLDRNAGQFRAIELPYKGTLFGVIGNDRVVLVHGLRGTLLRSADEGHTWAAVDTGLQVGLTGSALDADGRFIVVSQAGHVLVGTADGVQFKPAKIERPLPAAAVIAVSRDTVAVAGPRGVDVRTLR